MTGGRLIVLGKVGRNFAAGMSGGIAYVLNVDGNFVYFCNTNMVELSPVRELEDEVFLKEWIGKHVDHTGSQLGADILSNLHQYLPRFIKVLPIEYSRVLQQRKRQETSRMLAYIEPVPQ
jgi:glutamate synthase (NADPH/NADH) large chain